MRRERTNTGRFEIKENGREGRERGVTKKIRARRVNLNEEEVKKVKEKAMTD